MVLKQKLPSQFTSNYNEQLFSFVNNVRTKDGGTHESGLDQHSQEL